MAVSSFNVTAGGAGSQTGGGLSTMLMNALVESECFRVVERERLNEVMQEQSLGLSGAGDQNNFAQVGKLTGAQLLVKCTVTEFKDVESGGSVFGVPAGGLFFKSKGMQEAFEEGNRDKGSGEAKGNKGDLFHK